MGRLGRSSQKVANPFNPIRNWFPNKDSEFEWGANSGPKPLPVWQISG
jgi:hypothetical protein